MKNPTQFDGGLFKIQPWKIRIQPVIFQHTIIGIPSRELTYPQKWHVEDDFPFPKVGYVNSLEGITYEFSVSMLKMLVIYIAKNQKINVASPLARSFRELFGTSGMMELHPWKLKMEPKNHLIRKGKFIQIQTKPPWLWARAVNFPGGVFWFQFKHQNPRRKDFFSQLSLFVWPQSLIWNRSMILGTLPVWWKKTRNCMKMCLLSVCLGHTFDGRIWLWLTSWGW